MTLFVQGSIFLITLLTGIGLGLWIDLYRFINGRGKLPFIPVWDLFFWTVNTCIVFTVLMSVNFLELRMYVLLSMGIGLYLYFKCLSCHILRVYLWGFTSFVKMIKWLWHIFRPLALPFRVAAGLLDFLVLRLMALLARAVVRMRVFRVSRQDNPPFA